MVSVLQSCLAATCLDWLMNDVLNCWLSCSCIWQLRSWSQDCSYFRTGHHCSSCCTWETNKVCYNIVHPNDSVMTAETDSVSWNVFQFEWISYVCQFGWHWFKSTACNKYTWASQKYVGKGRYYFKWIGFIDASYSPVITLYCKSNLFLFQAMEVSRNNSNSLITGCK